MAEETPTPVDIPPQDHYRVDDLSDKKRTAHLHGKVTDGGLDRNTSRFAKLSNDISGADEETFKAYDHVEIRDTGTPIETNALTLAAWVNFQGESLMSSLIIGTNDDTNRCGLIVNANEETGDEDITGSLGYTWANHKIEIEDGTTKWRYQDIMFDVTIPKNKWTWIVLSIYPSGTTRLFVDNIYRKSYDEGYARDILKLKNLEVGRFSGLVDSVFIFSDNIDYGNVDEGMEITSEMSYLYNTSRQNPLESKRPTSQYIAQPPAGGIKFHYQQPTEYVEANLLYNQRTKSRVLNGEKISEVIKSQTQEMLNEQKHTITGGVNEGMRVYANDKFMTFGGDIREMG